MHQEQDFLENRHDRKTAMRLSPCRDWLQERRCREQEEAIRRTAEALEASEPGLGEEFLQNWSPEEVAKRDSERDNMTKSLTIFDEDMVLFKTITKSTD